MDLQHKIDRANMLYDEIARIEAKEEFYEDLSVSDLLKIVRMHDIAFDMTVDLIKKRSLEWQR